MKPHDPTLAHDPEPHLVPLPSKEEIERRARMAYECRNADAFTGFLSDTFFLLAMGSVALFLLLGVVWFGRQMQANNARLDGAVKRMEVR